MTSEELTTLNDVFGALNNDSNENANNYDIIIRNQTSGNAMKVPVATFKTVLYNYLTSASVAASLASVLGGSYKIINANTNILDINSAGMYFCSSNTEGITGIPSEVGTNGFFLKVFSGTPGQYYFELTTRSNDIYRNIHWGTTWNGWKKITTTATT